MSIILYNHYITRYLGSKFMIVIIFQSPKCNSNSIQKNDFEPKKYRQKSASSYTYFLFKNAFSIIYPNPTPAV